MKISISTTSKLYLLTLLVIFGAIFVNQSVFAQEDPFQTRSDKRMALLERYSSWIENKDYGDYKEPLGQRTLSEFNSYLSRVIPENQNCLKETDDQKLSDCKEKIKFDYKLAKKFNRVLKYLQIQESKPNVCVKADMGVGKALKALPENTQPAASGEKPEELVVYLCTDNSGAKLVRALSPSGALLKLSTADAARPELAVQNLPPKDSVDLLIKKMGLTQPSGEISANPNPCTIASTAQTCGEVEVEWDVTDDTSDPVEVKTKDGQFIERSRNGSADITDIGPDGQTFILYSLGRKIGEVVVKAIKQ